MIAAFLLAISLTPSPSVAQDGDTMSITGTFKMSEVRPTVGADLAGIQPDSADRWWRLTLHGVTYSHDYREWWDENGWYNEKYWTRAYATSYTLEFFGADAAVLNSTVSGQLAGGGLPGGWSKRCRKLPIFRSILSCGRSPSRPRAGTACMPS